MIKIVDTFDKISSCFINSTFDKASWLSYLNHIYPDFSNHILEKLSAYDFEKTCRPILENMIKSQERMELCHQNFLLITKALEEKILHKTGKSIDVDIVLYLSGCVAAGYATQIDGRNVVLLGMEKIIELAWEQKTDMYGLIYHELGHLYHDIYGCFLNDFSNDRETYLWMLFSEGIAMYFEQLLVGDLDFFHQDQKGWKSWNQKHFIRSLKAYHSALKHQPKEAKHFFGDWSNYRGWGDVGYYLGARFIRFLTADYQLDEMINFDMIKIEQMYQAFIDATIGAL